MSTPAPRTLHQKIWDAHVISRRDDGTCLIYIDRHLVHEVSSPQAFEGLRQAGLPVRRPDLTLAMPDHNVPTTARRDAEGNVLPIADPASAAQLAAIDANVREFKVPYFDATSPNQGIVHVVGPEQGFTLPGCTLVCGDSHTGAHGALGALAFGIGTTEVEHVLATQTLRLSPAKSMEVRVEGVLGPGVTAKDVILAIIGKFGVDCAVGHVIEYRGSTFEAMSIEERLTVANMSIEAGARAGLFAPDETTFAYLEGRPYAPKGAMWDQAVAHWRTLRSDERAVFDRSLTLAAAEIEPVVTWGTDPSQSSPISGTVPALDDIRDPARRDAMARALDYMGVTSGQAMTDIEIDHVFIGSCTNSRIEDLRSAASLLKGRRVAESVRLAIVVPGSGLVKQQAEEEGLDRIFTEAGFEWREPGCSACLGMNPDIIPPGGRCASTANRNFVGRQGPNARTHLMSPAMAAAAAISGRLADARQFAAKSLEDSEA